MRFTLVQPPLIEGINEALSPPLGLLAIGAMLREESADVELLDFNLAGLENPAILDPQSFIETAAQRIAGTGPDVVGFTSMALESHVCLQMARRLKELDPGISTLFGGPHFSAIATDVIERYPWTDFVVTGDGEQPVVDLLSHLRGRQPASDLINVAHRDRDRARLDRQYRYGPDFADLPFPDHTLIDPEAYFAINPDRMLCLEHARGCQLRCSFCYSEVHWGHGERIREEERIVEDLRRLAELGAGHVFFVADNFLTRPELAIRLSRAIEEARLPLTWKCYATLAQLTPPVVEALGSAGCRSVFIGVDAASEHNKKAFKKTYFKGWEPLRETLELCMSYEVHPTCSFMLSPEDTREGLEVTLRAALFTQCIGAHVTVNALAVYQDTELDNDTDRTPCDVKYAQSKPRLQFHTPAINHDNEFAEAVPKLYPMHQSAPALSSGHDLFAFCYIGESLIYRHWRSLFRFCHDHAGDLVNLIGRITEGADEQFENVGGFASSSMYRQALRRLLDEIDGMGYLPSIVIVEMLVNAEPAHDESRISVEVDGRRRKCRLNPYAVLALPDTPDVGDRLAKFESLDEMAPAHDYLVTVFAGAPRVARVDESLGALPPASLEMGAEETSWVTDPITFRRLSEALVLLPA